MRLRSNRFSRALTLGLSLSTGLAAFYFSAISFAKSAVTPLSERPLEMEFRIQFGQRHKRLFFATSTGQAKTTRAVLSEYSSSGDFAGSVSLRELASLNSQINKFLEQSKNAEPSKAITCLDPIDFNLRGQVPTRRCREAMSRAQKRRFFQLVENLSNFSRR